MLIASILERLSLMKIFLQTEKWWKVFDKNNLTLTVPSDGTLKVYARSGSSSAADRNIVLTQNGTELVNKILLESEAVSVPMTDDKGEKRVQKSFLLFLYQ